MPNFDFQGDLPYATHIGTAASNDYTSWDDVAFLVQHPSRLQLVRRPRRKGNFSVRVECRDDDISSGPSERTETFVNNTGRNLYTEGDHFWFATSLFVPDDHPTITSWYLVHQMHGAENGSPPFAVELTGEQIIFTARGGNIDVGGDTDWPRNNSYVVNATVPRGVWLDLLIYTELSVTSAGVNKVWYRQAGQEWPATPQVDVTGANLVSIATVALQLPPPRISIYRDHRTDTTVIYHGGVRIKQTREAAEAFFTDPTSLATEILADNPVGYWPLSETSGTYADLGSGNHPGTVHGEPLRGMPTLTRDGLGAAVNLKPFASYISVGDLSLGEGNACTMECLIRYVSGSAANLAVLSEGKASSGTPTNELGVFFNSARIVYVNDAASTTSVVTTGLGTRTVNDGKVHHLLMRWSKTLNRAEVFVDGEQQQTVAFAPGTVTLDNFTIGAHDGGGSAARYLGDMTVQHAAVYNTYLSDARVQARWMAAMRDTGIGTAPADLQPWAATHKALAAVTSPALGFVNLA